MDNHNFERDLLFEQELRSFMSNHLPDKIFNAHFHISRMSGAAASALPDGTPADYIEPKNEAETPFGQYQAFLASLLGKNKVAGGLVLPMVGTCKDTSLIADENTYNLIIAKKYDLAAGLLVIPESDPTLVASMVAEKNRIRALKPYMTYTSNPNIYESDILEFAPEWLWGIAHEYEFPVVLHIAHNGNQLSDSKNIEQIRFISKKYPKAKIVLAHCGMGYNSLKNRKGLEAIKDLKNIWFDCSGAPETIATYNCMKIFGYERMMWGDDYPYSTAMGRMRGLGSNYLGLTSDEMDFSQIWPDYRFVPFPNLIEGIMSLFEACELLGLGAKEIERVFYGNAAEFYSENISKKI